MTVNVSDAEMVERKKAWKAPPLKIPEVPFTSTSRMWRPPPRVASQTSKENIVEEGR